MPKSRGRHHRKNIRRSTGSRSRPRQPIDLARTAIDISILRATDAAEARGDAWAALQIIERDLASRGDEFFWRPEKSERLLQLVTLGSALPRWATSRWILAQALQTLDQNNRVRTRRAFDLASSVSPSQLDGQWNDIDRRVEVMDHDWLFRQMFLYELGGLAYFLSRVASADLVAGADRIHQWARTSMGGFRLLREQAQSLTWLNLTDDTEVETINLGTASLSELGDCAIGRLVFTEDGSMFETAPLFVPERVARTVADDPSGWVAALTAAGKSADSGEDAIVTSGHDFRLLTDVPGIVERLVTAEVHERMSGRPVVIETGADVQALRRGLIRAALDQQLPDRVLGFTPWPSVAATLLHPTVLADLGDSAGAEDGPKFRRLASLLGGPAADICPNLADELEAAAA